MSALLDRLERGADDDRLQAAQELTREMHSMKGAAGAIDQSEIEYLCRLLEQVLLTLQRTEMVMTASFFSTFRQAQVLLENGLQNVREGEKLVIPIEFFANVRKLV
jgi:chemotaxis protein histidine kinase CheA